VHLCAATAVLHAAMGPYTAGCAAAPQWGSSDLAAVQAALSMDSVRQLPFLTAVLHEAMRLFPAGVAATPW
jgi:hypothetical protein